MGEHHENESEKAPTALHAEETERRRRRFLWRRHLLDVARPVSPHPSQAKNERALHMVRVVMCDAAGL